MQLFLKILSGIANSVDPDQTAPSGAVWSGSALFALYHFVRNFGVRNFRTFTVPTGHLLSFHTCTYCSIQWFCKRTELHVHADLDFHCPQTCTCMLLLKSTHKITIPVELRKNIRAYQQFCIFIKLLLTHPFVVFTLSHMSIITAQSSVVFISLVAFSAE